MSIAVDVADLARALERFDSGYLLTTADGRVKVVTVDPRVDGDRLLVSGSGRGTLANLAANPAVTLVFPPREHHGHTLLVDGTAATDGDDVRITPATAVLHRPAAHADGPMPPGAAAVDGCSNDCAPPA